jgi:hypothetical protein
MLNRKSAVRAFGAAVVVAVMAVSVEGGSTNYTSYLTFNTPFALPGIAFPPGTYIFELPDPTVAPDLVRVMSRDRSEVYLTAFTRLVDRPRGLRADRQVTFGEVRRGGTPPITAWYPAGESVGRQFIYPRGSRQLIGPVAD